MDSAAASRFSLCSVPLCTDFTALSTRLFIRLMLPFTSSTMEPVDVSEDASSSVVAVLSVTKLTRFFEFSAIFPADESRLDEHPFKVSTMPLSATRRYSISCAICPTSFLSFALFTTRGLRLSCNFPRSLMADVTPAKGLVSTVTAIATSAMMIAKAASPSSIMFLKFRFDASYNASLSAVSTTAQSRPGTVS